MIIHEQSIAVQFEMSSLDSARGKADVRMFLLYKKYKQSWRHVPHFRIYFTTAKIDGANHNYKEKRNVR